MWPLGGPALIMLGCMIVNSICEARRGWLELRGGVLNSKVVRSINGKHVIVLMSRSGCRCCASYYIQ
jgi:hypothetical protein